MTTSDDLRDLRDALDSIAHGALPRWGTPTTKMGGEAQTAACEVYEKFVRAIMDASNARFTADSAKGCEDQQRAHAEALTSRCEAVEAEVEQLRDRCASYAEDVTSLNECMARLEAAIYEARDEAARLRAERRQLRRRLVECRPWVGVCPLEFAKINEVYLVRNLADDTLNEVPE